MENHRLNTEKRRGTVGFNCKDAGLCIAPMKTSRIASTFKPQEKGQRTAKVSVLSQAENTHRDKSLTGFSIWFAYLAKGEIYELDMCLRTRYAFAFLAKGEICQKLEGFISYLIADLLNIFRKTRIYRQKKKQEQE